MAASLRPTIQDIGRLEGKVDGIATSIDSINKKIVGNGQKGLMERMTAVEACITERTDDMKSTEEKLDTLIETVSRLADSVEKHHADKSQHTLWGMVNMKVVVVSFLFVVLIIATIPSDVNLFEMLMSFLGL